MYRTTLLLASLSLLTACGGSSSSTGTNTDTENNTLSLMAKYRDACGNETSASDAALLIHNSDYSNKEIIYADVNGKLTYQAEDSSQTISIVMRGPDEVSGVKPVILTTFMDYPMKDIGNYYHETKTTDACDCQNFALNVSVPARVNDIASGRISGVENTGQISNNIGSTFFDNLVSCKAPSDQWPLLSAMMSFTNPDESFGAFISDISNSVEVTAELEGIAVDIITNGYFVNKEVTTVINGKPYFRNYTSYTPNNVYGFASSDLDHYTVSSYNVELANDEILFFKKSMVHTKNINKTFDLPLPEIDYFVMAEIFLSADSQYDLSQTNMDFINIGIKSFKNDELILDWNFIAPTLGQVPAIDVTAFISDNTWDASVYRADFLAVVTGYSGINGYQDFINNISENTSENATLDKWVTSDGGINGYQDSIHNLSDNTSENATLDKWSRSEFALFQMAIPDVSLSGSTSPINISKIIKKHVTNSEGN